jgi:SAM-dependent methyltransferase
MTAPIPFKPRRFRSTAEFYEKYRVPYPPTLIEAVAARVGLKPGDRVLDLGCGPAMLAIGFARLGMKVTAMDPEPEMLSAAGRAAAAAGVDLDIRRGSSYDLGPAIGALRLVTMGRSFHWMDRPATLEALDSLLEPGGGVALFHDRRVSAMPDWQKVINDAAEIFSPERHESRAIRRSPDWRPHEAVLLASTFASVETLGHVFAQDLDVESILGRAYSMSVTSPEALGDRQAAFEAHVRDTLRALAPDGRFAEIVAAEAIVAKRPGEG